MKSAILSTCLFLTGCPTLFQNPSYCIDRSDGLCWYRHPVQLPTETLDWQVNRDAVEVSKECGYTIFHPAPSCVMTRWHRTCTILSVYTIQEAMQTPSNGRAGKSVYTHEVIDHCALGGGVQWLHTDTRVRGP